MFWQILLKSRHCPAAPYTDTKSWRTLVPLRFVGEALDATVEWRAENRQVIIADGGTVIVLTIASDRAMVNDAPAVLECAAELVSPGRTFVPLRFISETLGATVHFDAATRDITITR